MKKGRYKNLFGNMALFTVGNFVSKLLVMLLVPFYTNVLTTQEYGIADGMQATLLLLVPLLTINIGEAALRYGIESKGKSDKILRIILKYVGIADMAVALVAGIIYVLNIGNASSMWGVYALLFAGLFMCNSVYESVLLFCQGCEKVQIVVIGSIACTILVIISNLYFLLVLKIGLYGYIYAQMISFAGAAIVMLLFMFRLGFIAKGIEEKKDNKSLEKEMTSYGSSMLVYSTSSWINNAIDRYFVLGLCGAAANGLYGVAYKIPAILTVFQRIFAQAWQISANKNYDEQDSSEFFSKVYRAYQTIMVVGCAGLMLVLKLVARFLFAKDFFNAWTLVPPLLISVIFGALTGFLGSICLAFKDGKSMGRATGIGAIINVILNIIGIKYMGPMGAAIATMISYYTMYECAYHMVKKHVELNVNRAVDFIAYIILIIQAATIVFEMSIWFWTQVAGFVIIMIIYGKGFFEMIIERMKKNG